MRSEERSDIENLTGPIAQPAPRFRLIDLFSGAGGLSLGFTEALGLEYNPATHEPFRENGNRAAYRFEPVWANDLDPDAARTYSLNFGARCHIGHLEVVLIDPSVTIPPADVVIGGPPCQGFSLLNKNRLGDKRRELWRPFMDVVTRSGADLFVMENVLQLLGSDEHRQIERRASSLGFRLVSAKLLAADYGVPQLRWRAFIIGSRYGKLSTAFPPPRTHCRDSSLHTKASRLSAENESHLRPWRCLRDWIGDLPLRPVGTEIRRGVPPPLDLHFGRSPTDVSRQRYQAIPYEGMNRFDLQARAPELTPDCWIRKTKGGTDLFGRLWWRKPAFTIRTEFYKPEKGRYLHPQEHRPITHREAARLQGFPDWFRFTGPKIQVAKQIGNAVPPLLASRVADCAYRLLVEREIALGRSTPTLN